MIKNYEWYECSKCKKQGYTNDTPNEWAFGGCYPDGPKGPHDWESIGNWDTDTQEYPESDYDIS